MSYPGVRNGVTEFTYWCSHSASPGKAVLVTAPQIGPPPDESGDLVFGDGSNRIHLRDCRVDELLETQSMDGIIWTLTISDRRWRWRTGSIKGRYNQYDRQNKLIPWMIRSLKELATLCLEEMGERGYQIELPPGLSRKDGDKIDEYLRLGQNFKQTGTNPPINWDGSVPPAVCVSEIAERFGCRLIFQPNHDRAVIKPYGGDYKLNESLPYLSQSKGLKNPKVPQGVAVYGAETAHQCRLLLEPMALDYGSVIVPIDEASYAPVVTKTKLTVTVNVSHPDAPTQNITITVNGTAYTFSAASTSALAAAINASPSLSGILVATYAGGVLTLTQIVDGTYSGTPFTVTNFSYSGSGHPDDASGTIKTVDTSTTGRWKHNCPPVFPLCRATESLSRKQAQALARQSVWRMFRIKMIDLKGVPLKRGMAIVPTKIAGARPGGKKKKPVDPKAAIEEAKKIYTGKGIEIPGYGVVKRRQNAILLGRMAEQLTPKPRDMAGFDRDPAFAGGVMPDFYTGFSRDADARCYGEYMSAMCGTVLWFPQSRTNLNTPANTRVRVPFTIVADQQIVLFNDFVYRIQAEGDEMCYRDPNIVYEGAVAIQDHETQQVVRYVKSYTIPRGNGPVEYQINDDVIVSWIGTYGAGADDFTKLLKDRDEDFGDGKRRADYYLQGMLKRYQLPQSKAILYCGCLPFDPDSAIHQIVWKLSVKGPTTLVCANSEFSEIVPRYPDRRLAENLPPNAQAKLMNLSENNLKDIALPDITGFRNNRPIGGGG